MEVYTFLCVLSMTCSLIAEGTGAGLYMHNDVILWNRDCFLISYPSVAIKCICTVNLSADALSIPGGYVVPERGNITFTCNSSSGKMLFWSVRVALSGDPKQYIRINVGTTGLSLFSGFSVPDESSTTNPAICTFHNISSESNPSPVQCSDITIQENSTAIIIVEGEVSIQCHIKLI